MVNALLGSHKPSAEWYTPDQIWSRVYGTLTGYDSNTGNVFDPCPVESLEDGLSYDWYNNNFSNGRNIYVNPPTPAAPWAIKALQTHLEHPEVNIIFAAFSEAVIWQVNDLLDFPTCWVRNRISWIDGNQWLGKPTSVIHYSPEGDVEEVFHRTPNPNYLKPAKSPRNYNAFICLSSDRDVIRRFCENFEDLGTIRISHDMSVG